MAPDGEALDATHPQKRRKTYGDSSPPYPTRGDAANDEDAPPADQPPDHERRLSIRERQRDSRTVSRSPAGDGRGGKYYQGRSRRTSRSRSSTRSDPHLGSRSRSPSRSPRSRSHSRSRSRTRSETSSNRTRTDDSLSPRPARPSPPRDGAPLRPRPNYRPRLALHGHTKPVSQVRISPDGRFVASASADATVKIWDAVTGDHLDTLVGHMAGVSCLAWTPDSNTIASGSDDKAIRLWDRVTGRPRTTARKTLAGQEMAPLKGHHNYIHCLAFSPKGNILASGSYDEAVFLWDVRAGRLMRSLPAHSDPVSGIDFCRDGTLVVSCSTDGLIRVWDTSTGQCLRTLVHEDNPAVTNVCFSPNGRFVLAFNLDNCIRLWDYVSGSVKKTYQGHRNEKFALGGCFGVLNEEPFIASASEDGSVVLWDVRSKEILQRVEGHKGVCFWVDVHDETMATAGQDHVVRVYRHVQPATNGVNGTTEKEQEKEQEKDTLPQELPGDGEDFKMENS